MKISNIYFTADTHFGHERIIELCDRPFKDLDDMNNSLVERWNDTVPRDAVVYVLGDFALGKIADNVLFANKLNGNKILFSGNHDKTHPYRTNKKKNEDAAAYHARLTAMKDMYTKAGFKAVINTPGTVKIDGKSVVLSHFPYHQDKRHGEYDTNDGIEDRYLEYRPQDKGQWLLHGHVHTQWRHVGRQINVGVDVWDYKPVHIKQVADIIHRTDFFIDSGAINVDNEYAGIAH